MQLSTLQALYRVCPAATWAAMQDCQGCAGLEGCEGAVDFVQRCCCQRSGRWCARRCLNRSRSFRSRPSTGGAQWIGETGALPWTAWNSAPFRLARHQPSSPCPSAPAWCCGVRAVPATHFDASFSCSCSERRSKRPLCETHVSGNSLTGTPKRLTATRIQSYQRECFLGLPFCRSTLLILFALQPLLPRLLRPRLPHPVLALALALHRRCLWRHRPTHVRRHHAHWLYRRGRRLRRLHRQAWRKDGHRRCGRLGCRLLFLGHILFLVSQLAALPPRTTLARR